MDSVHRNDNKPARKQQSQRAGSFHAPNALVVGLTGGIATGKSTVAGMLEELGAKVLSADAIVHELLKPGTDVWKRVVSEFGRDILSSDGSIDRPKLAGLIFRDPEKRKRLESILHPPVIERLSQEAERFRECSKGVLVLEIPLLVETASLEIVDKVLVVVAEQETQIDRLQKRYGVTRDEALLRIDSQLPLSEKIKVADWVVSTEGSLQHTKEELQRVWSVLQKSLAQP